MEWEDHIHSLIQLRGKIKEYWQPLRVTLVGYGKALDSGQITAVFEAVRKQVEEICCEIFGFEYEDGTTTVTYHTEIGGI